MTDSKTQRVIDDFHKLYYYSNVWKEKTLWMGTRVWKCPLDLWVYQEILFKRKPDIIIETGTAFGGSAMFFAHMCDIIGKGKILSIDSTVSPPEGTKRPKHPRITYIHSHSIAKKLKEQLKEKTKGKKRVMVILDSDHHKEYVDEELEFYKDLVTIGDYLVVEDTNLQGFPVYLPQSQFGDGPMHSVKDFLYKHDNFVCDIYREKFFMTFSPCGYLKRVK